MFFRDPYGRVFFASPQALSALQRSLGAGGTGCTSWRSDGSNADATSRADDINHDSAISPGFRTEWVGNLLVRFHKSGRNTTTEYCNSPEDTPPADPTSCGPGEELVGTKCVAKAANPPPAMISSSATPLILGALAVVAVIGAAAYFSGRGPAVVVASGARGARGARGPAARRRRRR